MLGDLNTEIQLYNPRSQQVAEMLMGLGLVDLQHHLVSAGGSDICKVISDLVQHTVAENVCIHLWDTEETRLHEYNKGQGGVMLQRTSTGRLWSCTQQRQANYAAKGSTNHYGM